MTAQEVAALLRVSSASVYRWAEDGTLDAIRIGGVVRFKRAEVEAKMSTAPGPEAA